MELKQWRLEKNSRRDAILHAYPPIYRHILAWLSGNVIEKNILRYASVDNRSETQIRIRWGISDTRLTSDEEGEMQFCQISYFKSKFQLSYKFCHWITLQPSHTLGNFNSFFHRNSFHSYSDTPDTQSLANSYTYNLSITKLNAFVNNFPLSDYTDPFSSQSLILRIYLISIQPLPLKSTISFFFSLWTVLDSIPFETALLQWSWPYYH